MTRWEYFMLEEKREVLKNQFGENRVLTEVNGLIMGKGRVGQFQSVTEAYYELGQNGWELVTITQNDAGTVFWGYHYFKRPLVKRQQT